ncbi:hypothetical protein [Faecalibacter rhinopitheci]|uniref:Lipocalin-like domain-containing protein n=1 Tax=Faecalibacter rhinopitheci TaxID=2779678 RepID=A0A8J7K319_9FLAO|nr:hypothetical protein [Faecalibacter rhinopitheci]MBF0596048.1 hypothetical protein [Faecalibacter rhinopitheci]
MKKVFYLLLSFIVLQSCVVSTAANAVKTVAKVSYGVVKGTVKAVSWTVSKAKGKISEDKLNGSWKLVGIYNGSFKDYNNDKQANVAYNSNCNEEIDVMEFKSKKSKFKTIHCDSQKVNWEKYKLEFGKNPLTKEKENYISYGSKKYISVIDVTNKTMALEGNNLYSYNTSGTQLYLFEKK